MAYNNVTDWKVMDIPNGYIENVLTIQSAKI